MRLIGTAGGGVTTPLSPTEALEYVRDPRRLLRGVPQCVLAVQLHDVGVYQWCFDMPDPFGNSFRIHAVIRQTLCGTGEILWRPYELDWSRIRLDGRSFLGRANGRIGIEPAGAGGSRLTADLEFAIDFALPTAMKKLPLRWVERASAALMDKKMAQFVEQIMRSLEISIGTPIAPQVHSAGRFA
jgi:hypothetical protein